VLHWAHRYRPARRATTIRASAVTGAARDSDASQTPAVRTLGPQEDRNRLLIARLRKGIGDLCAHSALLSPAISDRTPHKNHTIKSSIHAHNTNLRSTMANRQGPARGRTSPIPMPERHDADRGFQSAEMITCGCALGVGSPALHSKAALWPCRRGKPR